MLPAERRVRRREDFSATVRHGLRLAAPGLVVHVAADTGTTPARAGFIIGRSVGTAVTRNRLRRQLRHLVAAHLSALPSGTDVVVRVTPGAVGHSRRELSAAIDGLLDRASRVVTPA